MNKTNAKILAVCGFKKSGKTSLIETLLNELIPKGLRMGVIKRQNEPVQTDKPGSDTYRFFHAGASVLGFDGVSTFVKQKQSLPFSLDQALE
ncbi:MAG: molybdopterin-guanine dinucleotide biosynthesis protein B [Planctomycetes bacterium]|nr:molybdopterin-guanine dinucleotide biosynthesis protein B [Planctomycetota bacterium]